MGLTNMVNSLPLLVHSVIRVTIGSIVGARAGVVFHHAVPLVAASWVMRVVVVARDAVAPVYHGVILVASGVLGHVWAHMCGHLGVTVALHLPQGVLGVD